jgi:hypothetical protein
MSWTLSGSAHWVIGAVPIKPATLTPTDTPTATPTNTSTATFTATSTLTPTSSAWPTPIDQTAQPPGTYENTDNNWYYIGSWTQVNDAGDSGGSRHEADTPWSSAQLTFNGNGIDFVYRQKSSYGIAEIYIDGDKYASVDQYNESEQTGQSIHVTLADGEHVLEIRRADRKNPGSSGYVVNLDKVVVYSVATPTATQTPTVSPTPTGTPTPTPTLTYKQITVGETVSTHIECNYSIDFSHTVDEGDDRLLVVTFVHRREDHQNVWGVKYNNVGLTKVADRGDPGGDDAIVHMWYMVDPPVGTHDVYIGINGSACTVAGAYNLYGVDVTDPLVDYDTTITWTGPVSLTLDSSAGDMGVDVVGINGTSGRSPGEGQTEQWDLSTSGSGDGWREQHRGGHRWFGHHVV